MNIEKIRSVLIKILLGTLIVTSLVAVGIILLGSVNDLFWRVIWTLAAGIFYVGVLLAILSTIPHVGTGRKSRSTLFAINSMLALTCASYLTSILSIWTVIHGDLPLRIHLAYLITLGGVLYAKPLIDLEQVYEKIRPYIRANYVFIALACVLAAAATILPPEWNLWNGFLGRAVAASIVVDVTLSMVITVLYHLYTQQHPEVRRHQSAVTGSDGQVLAQEEVVEPRKKMNPWLIVLIVVACLFATPMLFGILSVILMGVSNFSSF